jgi:hypothetical protein
MIAAGVTAQWLEILSAKEHAVYRNDLGRDVDREGNE